MTEPHLESYDWSTCLSDLPPALDRSDKEQIRERLKSGLREATKDVPRGTRITLNRYNLSSALACPASGADTPFEATTITTSRALAIRSINARRDFPDLRSAIDAAIQEAIETQDWMASFLGHQDEAARAATVARALSWAGRVMTVAPWSSLAWSKLLEKGTWHSPLGFGSAVSLQARPDMILTPSAEAKAEKVLLSFGWPDVHAAGLDALVAMFESGLSPRRYLMIYPSSGTPRGVNVDAEFLAWAADKLVEATAALAPSTYGERLFADPGRACWTCDHRYDCAPGREWMDTQPRRRGGIVIEPVDQ